MKYLKWIIPITAIFAILFVGLGIYITQADKPVQSAVNGSQAQIEPLNADKILSLVNAERAKAGVAPLVSDPRLVQSAQAKADDMVTNNYFGHINPTTGRHGYEYVPTGMCLSAGENIGNSIDLSGDNNQDTVDWWMNSKPHHDAMLNPDLVITGVAVNGHYTVQHFCQQ